MITEIEKMIINRQMAETLAELNGYFIKHESITKEQFMDMQLNVWNRLKEDLTKHNND